jgi:hypothetical protein
MSCKKKLQEAVAQHKKGCKKPNPSNIAQGAVMGARKFSMYQLVRSSHSGASQFTNWHQSLSLFIFNEAGVIITKDIYSFCMIYYIKVLIITQALHKPFELLNCSLIQIGTRRGQRQRAG